MDFSAFAFWRKTDDQIRNLIEKSCKLLIADKKFPNHVCFDIPKSSYLAHIFLTKDLVHEGEWRLQVGAMADGTDKMFSNFLVHDTKENLLEALATAQVKEEIFDSIKKLHERAKQDD